MDNLEFDEEAHVYKLNGIFMPSVSSVLKKAGLVDFSGVPIEALERARQFGSAVHKACELYDKKTLDMTTVDLAIIPYLEAWVKFLKDFKVEILENEQPVYSKRFWFAGRPDRKAIAADKLSIIDLKSSSSIYPSMRLQTAGYKIASDEMSQEKIKQRLIIQLLKNGDYRVEPCKDPSDMEIFMSAVILSKWKKRNNIGGNSAERNI